MSDGSGTDEAKGSWDAISTTCAAIYGAHNPLHIGTQHKFALGGPDPIDGISFYPRDDHWHIVTYGYSDLYGAEGPDEDGDSGFGVEMTVRIVDRTPDKPGMDEASRAPKALFGYAQILQMLAKYVFQTGNVFGPTHKMELKTLQERYAWGGALFVRDSELGEIETPSGSVEFVQLVLVTPDEFAAARDIGVEAFVDLVRHDDSLLLSDPDRPCRMADPEFRTRVEKRLAEHGSPEGALSVESLAVERSNGVTTITVEPKIALRMRHAFRHMLPFGRTFAVMSDDAGVLFHPPGEDGPDDDQDSAVTLIALSAEQARALGAVYAGGVGDWTHPSAPALVVRVEATRASAASPASARRAGKQSKGCLGVLALLAVPLVATIIAALVIAPAL